MQQRHEGISKNPNCRQTPCLNLFFIFTAKHQSFKLPQFIVFNHKFIILHSRNNNQCGDDNLLLYYLKLLGALAKSVILYWLCIRKIEMYEFSLPIVKSLTYSKSRQICGRWIKIRLLIMISNVIFFHLKTGLKICIVRTKSKD